MLAYTGLRPVRTVNVNNPKKDRFGAIPPESAVEQYKELNKLDDAIFEKTWKIVSECGEQERHFNGLQNSYRTLASTWLLAMFGGIGFFLAQKLEYGNSYRLFLIWAVALAGCLGLVLLWVMDLLVYHRLLDAVFVEGVKLERCYSWLPPFRNNMLRVQHGGVLPKVVWFYLGSSGSAALISTISLVLWIHSNHGLFAAVIAGAIQITASVAGLGLLRSRSLPEYGDEDLKPNTEANRKR